MKFLLCFCMPVALVLTFALSHAVEQVRPPGFEIGLTYEISQATLDVGDTLVITRTVVNRETFALSGLYFGESLPVDFQVLDYAVTINGQPIVCTFAGIATTALFPGYSTYHWVIDDPLSAATVHTVVDPGDSLTFVLTATAGQAGEFALPLHHAAFYGNGDGFFAISDDIPMITVGVCCEHRGDVDDSYGWGGNINVSDLSFLVDFLFNAGPAPPCQEQANVDASSDTGSLINIGDLTYLVAYLFANGPAPPPCPVSGDQVADLL